jgi:hypothetical protein
MWKRADGLMPSETPEPKIFMNNIIVKIVHRTTNFCNVIAGEALEDHG